EFAGTAVVSTRQLARLVQETPPGRKVDMSVSRDGKKLSLSAKIGKREGSGGKLSERGAMPRFEKEFEFGGPPGGMFRFKVPQGDGREFFFNGPDGGSFGVFSAKPRIGVTLQTLSEQM